MSLSSQNIFFLAIFFPSLAPLSLSSSPLLTVGQRLGVGQHLLLVRDELGPLGLVQGAGQARDRVVVRAALEPREDGEVDLVVDVVGDLLALLVDGADAWLEVLGSKRGEVKGGVRLEVRKTRIREFFFSLPLPNSLRLKKNNAPFRKKIIAPRGPRSDLCVVVVTTSACSKGEGTRPAATRPEMWAMSARSLRG